MTGILVVRRVNHSRNCNCDFRPVIGLAEDVCNGDSSARFGCSVWNRTAIRVVLIRVDDAGISSAGRNMNLCWPLDMEHSRDRNRVLWNELDFVESRS